MSICFRACCKILYAYTKWRKRFYAKLPLSVFESGHGAEGDMPAGEACGHVGMLQQEISRYVGEETEASVNYLTDVAANSLTPTKGLCSFGIPLYI